MPGKKGQEQPAGKAKAQRMNLGSLVVTGAWERTYSTGKKGWFGQVVAQDGTKYQIIGAVEIAPKS
jgi:hypothetical protein